LDDRRRDGGNNTTLRIKEQGMHLTLNEHDDDDDDKKEAFKYESISSCYSSQRDLLFITLPTSI